MSNTHRHKINAKFKQGLIKWPDVPIFLKLWGWRHNGSLGEYRHKRIVKRIKELDHGSNN